MKFTFKEDVVLDSFPAAAVACGEPKYIRKHQMI
jgi:hypothetical protein